MSAKQWRTESSKKRSLPHQRTRTVVVMACSIVVAVLRQLTGAGYGGQIVAALGRQFGWTHSGKDFRDSPIVSALLTQLGWPQPCLASIEGLPGLVPEVIHE